MRKGLRLRRGLSLLAALMLAGACVQLPEESTRVDATASVIAFPGAQGGGKMATGGRGGEVVYVTNLNDSGAGSFRDAVGTSNRIVVFAVSGTIELKSNILVASNVTIAGQTAPGGSGITLKNYKLGMSGDNIICRYISSRPGPYASTSSGNDAWGGAKGSSSMIDHCSMGWTTDEQWGLYSNNEYYTVQYSVIGPADSWGGHSKGVHGFGLMMGKGYSTFDHNLIIHCVSRNFRGKVVGTETADFTNNVIYNWGYQTAYGTIGHLNYVGNTLKVGPDTTGGYHYMYVDSSTSPTNFSVYATGNRLINLDNSPYGTLCTDNWSGIRVKDGLGITVDSIHSTSAFQTLVDGVNVSTATTCESAEASYANVIAFAGNGISTNKRTAIDMQCVNEVSTGTGTMSGTAAYADATEAEAANIDKYGIECGVTYSYPSAVLTNPVVDSDGDGMPDEWETARGLNPTSKYAADGSLESSGDYCGLGYTNIEYYINDLTIDSFPEGVVTLSPTSDEPYEPTYTVLDGTLIRDLTIYDNENAADWSIKERFNGSEAIYGDRDATFATTITELNGAEWISTACDSKAFGNDLAKFTAGDNIDVYVTIDNRITTVPSWLSGWTQLRTTISASNDVTYNVYRLSAKAGDEITLGTNGQSSGCVGYMVFAVKASGGTQASLWGDLNEDSIVDVRDVALAAKKSAGASVTISAQGLLNADVKADGSINIQDVAIIAKLASGFLKQADCPK